MPFPITHAEIRKTETKLGLTFPLGFKARMARENGGEVRLAGEPWFLIPFLDTNDRKRLARSCNDILRESQSMRKWPRFPEQGYVIAQDGLGNYLVLLPLGEKPTSELGETIYFWDHELGTLECVAECIEELAGPDEEAKDD